MGGPRRALAVSPPTHQPMSETVLRSISFTRMHSKPSDPSAPDNRHQPRGGPAWRALGDEPDYRFTLANERTFLAWIRTALALLAAGVLLDQFSTKLTPQGLVVTAAALLCLVAAALSALAYMRWRGNEIAMREKVALPHSKAIAFLAAMIGLVCFVLCALIVVSAVGR